MKLETLSFWRSEGRTLRPYDIETVEDDMEVFQDNLCLILDLEGFFINKTFHSRELGYFTWYQEHGRHAFFVPVPYKTLCDKDKRTVNFVISKIHGLSYQPSQTEHAQNPWIVGTLIKDLSQDNSTAERTVVGYKGGLLSIYKCTTRGNAKHLSRQVVFSY